MRWGREVTGALPSGTDISKGIREHDPKSVFEVENTSEKSQSTSPSCSMVGGSQPGSCKSNAISRRCGGSRAQTRRNAERWAGFKRSISVGEGGGTAGAIPSASVELATAETWLSEVWPGWGPAAWMGCCKAPSGMRKSGASATPTRSPGSRSATRIKGSTCRPEATKCFCPEKMSGCSSMSTR